MASSFLGTETLHTLAVLNPDGMREVDTHSDQRSCSAPGRPHLTVVTQDS